MSFKPLIQFLVTQLNLNLFLATIFVSTAPYRGNSLYDEFWGPTLENLEHEHCLCVFVNCGDGLRGILS